MCIRDRVFYGPKNPESQLLGEIMQANLIEMLQPENTRKSKPCTDSVYLIYNAPVPALLVECGFLSNPDDAYKLVNADYQKRIAFAVFTGVCEYLNSPGRTKPPEGTKPVSYTHLDVYKRQLFGLIVCAMALPKQVILIPLLREMSDLHLYDTLWAVIFPTVGWPFGVFLMKQFSESIPGEILEAARVDGSSELRTFTTIVVPMIKPGIGALAIFTFINSWNCLLYTSPSRNCPTPAALEKPVCSASAARWEWAATRSSRCASA